MSVHCEYRIVQRAHTDFTAADVMSFAFDVNLQRTCAIHTTRNAASAIAQHNGFARQQVKFSKVRRQRVKSVFFKLHHRLNQRPGQLLEHLSSA